MAQDVNASNQFNQIQQASSQLVALLNTINTLQDKFTQDTTLAARTATQAQAAGYTTLATADYTNWASAVNQLLFTFGSGNPTQKSFIYKVL